MRWLTVSWFILSVYILLKLKFFWVGYLYYGYKKNLCWSTLIYLKKIDLMFKPLYSDIIFIVNLICR